VAALCEFDYARGKRRGLVGPGELMAFLATGEETGGTFFLAEVWVAPGGGTPPHIHHRGDESFQMLEGTLMIQVGGNTITAQAGDFAYLPRGIAHSFKNTGEGNGKALVPTTLAGLVGVDRAATPPPVNKELIGRAMATGPRYGLELLPCRVGGDVVHPARRRAPL
jgi:quercetin dioxygenase-like cupin family protein